jgi:hypothetical protein
LAQNKILKMDSLHKKVWWDYLEKDLQELLKQSLLLKEIFGTQEKTRIEFDDYSFLVFPAAKAYEGFLKKMFLDLGFITEKDYYGKRFRVGKALNPSLDKRYWRESVYRKIVTFQGNSFLGDKLWETWKLGRNLVFHWFPDEKKVLSYKEAVKRVDMIIETIDLAFKECKMKECKIEKT